MAILSGPAISDTGGGTTGALIQDPPAPLVASLQGNSSTPGTGDGGGLPPIGSPL